MELLLQEAVAVVAVHTQLVITLLVALVVVELVVDIPHQIPVCLLEQQTLAVVEVVHQHGTLVQLLQVDQALLL
jgi:hypothetical protein